MKKWAMVIMVILCLGGTAHASDVSLTAQGGLYFPTDAQFQQGSHLQLNLNWKNVYVFGSYTMTERRIAGQRAGAFNILGLGLGLNIPITKNLSMWGQGGYYIPKSGLVGTTQGCNWDDWANFQEVHYLYWNKWGADHQYSTQGYKIYEYRLQTGSMGGAIGINLIQPITKKLSVGVIAGYQFLRFTETFYARNVSNPSVSYIQTRQDAKLDGCILNVSVTYKF